MSLTALSDRTLQMWHTSGGTMTTLPDNLTGPDTAAHWHALRGCWLDLQNPEIKSYEDTDFSAELRRRHSKAIEVLIACEAIEARVAHAIVVAFEQAIFHVRRQMATCYLMLPLEFIPRENLVAQAAALTEMIGRSDIEPQTVARARAALERDMTWLAQFEAGKQPGNLDQIQTTPAEVEAARVLVDLLLERG
jgi:hypothetical protein